MEHNIDKKWIEIRLKMDGTFWVRTVEKKEANSVAYQSWIAITWEDMLTKLQEAFEELYATDKY